jgi:hypothetical protein
MPLQGVVTCSVVFIVFFQRRFSNLLCLAELLPMIFSI